MSLARPLVAALAAAALAPAPARAGAALVARTETSDGGGLAIEDPSGIASLPNGHFVVVDDHSEGSPRFRGENLWELDLAARRSVRAQDLRPVTSEPSDVAFCAQLDALVVADDDALRLLLFSPAGEPRGAIDLAAAGAKDPEGVACDAQGGRIFVADGKARQVLELANDGALVRRLDLSGLPFANAQGIAWDAARERLILVSDEPPALFELDRDGSLVAAQDLVALGARRPRGLSLGPASEGRGTSLYVADAGERHVPDGRILEVALGARPAGARVRTALAGDVDGFGFRGDEPGFAQGDLDHDGLLEPGERLPDAPLAEPPRDAGDPPGTDAPVLVGESQPLRIDLPVELGGGEPVWARLTLVVGGARALPGRRSIVRADGRLLGELIPARDDRIVAGRIGATLLELPPAALRELRDGRLRVEIAREPGSGENRLWLDFVRLEVAVAPAAPPARPQAAPKKGGNS